MKEDRVLENVAYLIAKLLDVIIADVNAVDQ